MSKINLKINSKGNIKIKLKIYIFSKVKLGHNSAKYLHIFNIIPVLNLTRGKVEDKDNNSNTLSVMSLSIDV